MVSARPTTKSVSRTTPSSSISTLRGWIAPCTMPAPCAFASASITATPIAAATGGESLPPGLLPAFADVSRSWIVT